MGKIKKLLDKTKRNGETKKWKMYLFVVVGILVIIGGFFGVYIISDVDGYIDEVKEVPHLYKFYNQISNTDQKTVFFIGSSVMGEAIYAPLINEILNEQGYDFTSYNLVVLDDLPKRRTVQIQNIIDAKPQLIVYGMTYHDLVSDSWNQDGVVLVHENLKVRDDSLYLFNENELIDFDTEPTPFFKKKFLRNAFLYKFFGITTPEMSLTLDYYTDPFGKDLKMTAETKKNMQEIISGAEDENNEWRPVVPENPVQRDAFLYNVKTLNEAGIPVVIVNQPLHPLYSDKITDESRKNYFNVLNETNVTYYDYEKLFGDECFHDSHHLSWTGSLAYAPYMADLIIQAMT